MNMQVHRFMDECEVIMSMADRNMVNMTITVTRTERKALKQLALDRDTTVSALFREWLKQMSLAEPEPTMGEV